ncbi:sodium-dependent transporter [Methanococcus maripaludis]|uniref:Transporter n=1 Tax=Methanococcus maripaludis TaxID=39152 RepID=A0A7J9PNY8_METMI|nr:sodium-dependent transporter [Methanococcus maripaludis]MBA2864494.1 NSS family neurotransmitter:Na+ symporter [Methanococcus maripaludis]
MAREQWASKMGFILAAVGSAVGLGNIWRFPYMAYENGGGAFLIPYFVALLFVGIMVMVLELALGHSTKGSAPLALRRLGKNFEWIGWLAIATAFIITTYYTAIIAWALVYLVKLFMVGFPTDFGGFFFSDILALSSGHGDLGGFNLPILVGLALIWGVNYIVVNSGVRKGLEKANEILMPVLFFLILALVVRSITLPGGLMGIEYYLTPNFAVLLTPKVWIDAFSQIFFTLSLGFGIMVAYSSYLPKKSDLTASAFTISLMNCGFSFLAGFAVFGTLGYMAMTQGVPISEVVTQSIGLAFVAFPQALSLMPGGIILAAIFFIALFVAGISSSVSLVESTASAVIDKFNLPRHKAASAVIATSFFASLIYATNAGLYWLDSVDHYINWFTIPLVAVLEIIVSIWIFKGSKLEKYIDNLSEYNLGSFWKFFAGIFSPLFLIYMILNGAWTELTAGYEGYAPIFLLLSLGIPVFGLVVSLIMPMIPWIDKGREIEEWDEFVKKDEE